MDFIKWLQSRLTSHGYAPGLIDGEMGNLTHAALKAFQRSKGLPQTGAADDATVAALRATSAHRGVVLPVPVGVHAPLPASMVVWPRQERAADFYGAVGTNQVKLLLPFPMKLAWDRRRVVNAMTLHAKVAESAGRCFAQIAETYDAKARADLGIDIFGGSLNVRKMRGGSAWSMHSWGIAIDFDPERNQLKWGADRARLAQPDAIAFWRIWEAEGWVSLGRAKNYDWMHVQAARL